MKSRIPKKTNIEAYKKSFLEKEKALAVEAEVESKKSLIKLKKTLKELTRNYPYIKKVIVFGSLVRRKLDTKSDIDVYMEPGRASDYWDIKAILENALKRDVDLLTPDDDSYIIDRVRETGEVIYERAD